MSKYTRDIIFFLFCSSKHRLSIFFLSFSFFLFFLQSHNYIWPILISDLLLVSSLIEQHALFRTTRANTRINPSCDRHSVDRLSKLRRHACRIEEACFSILRFPTILRQLRYNSSRTSIVDIRAASRISFDELKNPVFI